MSQVSPGLNMSTYLPPYLSRCIYTNKSIYVCLYVFFACVCVCVCRRMHIGMIVSLYMRMYIHKNEH